MQTCAKGSQSEAHQSGQSFASSLMGNVKGAAQSTNPHNVPGFQTDQPKESSLNSGSIGEAAFQVSRTNEAAQHIISEAKDRKSFKIDPDTDPLLVAGDEAIKDPQKVLREEFVEVPVSIEGASEEVKTCEEAGDEFLEECEEVRIVTVPEIKKHRSSFIGTPYGWQLIPTIYRNCNVITGETWCPYNYGYCYYDFNLANPIPTPLRHRIKSY